MILGVRGGVWCFLGMVLTGGRVCLSDSWFWTIGLGP
jgi:hypothetical protein